jgi:hypothetical protein
MIVGSAKAIARLGAAAFPGEAERIPFRLSFSGQLSASSSARSRLPARSPGITAMIPDNVEAFSGYAPGGGPDINGRGLAQAMPAVTGSRPAGIDVTQVPYARRHPRQDREGCQTGLDRLEVARSVVQDGSEPPPGRTRAEFTRFVADEHALWGRKLRKLRSEIE